MAKPALYRTNISLHPHMPRRPKLPGRGYKRSQPRDELTLPPSISNRLESFKAANAMYFCFYNFMRFQHTLRMTSAMQAGLIRGPLTIHILVEMAQ